MKTRVITSAVGLVVLFAVMALFDTFVFNVVIAAICLLAIHEVFKAFRFEKGPVSLHIIRMDDRFAPERTSSLKTPCIPLPIMLFRPEKKYSYLSAGMSTNKIHS